MDFDKPALSEEEYSSLCERMAECVDLGTEEGHRVMSQCLTEDYCKGWNDCYDAIMKKLEELK